MIQQAHPVVSAQIGGLNPARDAVAAMAPVPQSDNGATAANVEPARVDPLTKSNISRKGKLFTFHNPVEGQGTFVPEQPDTAVANSITA